MSTETITDSLTLLHEPDLDQFMKDCRNDILQANPLLLRKM